MFLILMIFLVAPSIKYLEEQDHVKSFASFLQELEQIPAPTKQLVESEQFQKEFESYQKLTPIQAKARAEDIIQRLANTKDPHMKFILAAAFANLSRWKEFYETFLQAYAVDPKHFMAHKTKALLNLRLFEMTHDTTLKEKIIYHLSQAKDIQSYKLMISFSEGEQKQRIMIELLNNILIKNMLLPRTEVAYVVECALLLGKKDVARTLIDRFKPQNNYSRSIAEAEQLVESVP